MQQPVPKVVDIRRRNGSSGEPVKEIAKIQEEI